jgi:hypothetical protein
MRLSAGKLNYQKFESAFNPILHFFKENKFKKLDSSFSSTSSSFSIEVSLGAQPVK